MFPPISASLLILLIVSIAVQRHFNLTQSHLSIFAFVAYIVSVITKKSLTRPTSRNFFLLFSPINLMVSGLQLSI